MLPFALRRRVPACVQVRVLLEATALAAGIPDRPGASVVDQSIASDPGRHQPHGGVDVPTVVAMLVPAPASGDGTAAAAAPPPPIAAATAPEEGMDHDHERDSSSSPCIAVRRCIRGTTILRDARRGLPTWDGMDGGAQSSCPLRCLTLALGVLSTLQP